MKSSGVRILTRSDLERLLSLEDCIVTVEKAFALHAREKSLAPGLLHIDVPQAEGEFHIKCGGLELEEIYACLKMSGGYFQNPTRFGLPSIQSAILLWSGKTGSLLACMDGIHITIYRTGAAVAVAAKYLARCDSATVGIFGCGNQGRMQLRALSLSFPLKKVYAYDVDAQAKKNYAQEMSELLQLEVVPASNVEETSRARDIIVACTPARKFYLEDRFVEPGTFIAAVGADSPGKQELEPTLFRRAKIVVDILEQCVRVGELQHPIRAGLTTPKDVHGELGQVITGDIRGRTSDDEIIIFDTTGTAIQDCAAAALAYRRAVEQGVGQVIHPF